MSDSRFQPGDIVRDTHNRELGIGRVKDSGRDRPLVEFWSGKEERKDPSRLALLEDPAPVALLWDKSDALEPWVREKPLKLVALALLVEGGRANDKSIKQSLEFLPPLGWDWKGWWRQRTRALNALAALPDARYFGKTAKGNVYTLRASVGAMPDDARPPVSLDDWKGWLTSEHKLPTFGKNPSKVFCDALAEWPDEAAEQAMERLLWGAELLLNSPRRPSAAAALAWMDAVGSAALRYGAVNPGDSETAQRSGDLLARLASIVHVREKRRESTLFLTGMLSEEPDRLRQLAQQRQEYARQREALESQLGRQRQEQERQAAEYESRLERQRQEQERQGASHAAELEELRQAHKAELDEERGEKERLRRQVETLRNQLLAGYEHSKLDIRQDMLVLVGELLQLATRQDGPSEEFLRDMHAGLALALQAGDAERLDEIGDVVAFDPLKHQSAETVKIGDGVKVTAPGVVVKGQRTGDRILVKAQVSRFSEKS